MLLKIYPVNPDPKEIVKVVKALEEGELVIYPTDTSYAIGCDALNVRAVERICKIKGVNPQKVRFSMICADLSQASEYARISNNAFQLMKRNLPGPFTFVLPTASSLPKLYKNRKTVGIRIPDNPITLEIVSTFSRPILTTSLPMPQDEEDYVCNPALIHEIWQREVAVVIDDGIGGLEQSTVIDCSGDEIEIVREGKGVLQ